MIYTVLICRREL